MLQNLLQQNRSVTGEDKVATDAGECKQYCGMPLLTDLAVMMRIDPLALIHGLREFVTVVYGPVMSFVFPDVQVKAYRNSVLYVNLVSAEEDLMAMALSTKPHNNLWLYLSPRLCTLGEDAFEHAPAVIKEIHLYLKNLFDARELAGGMMLKSMQESEREPSSEMLSEGISEPDRELRQGFRKLSIGLILALYVTFGHENFVKGPENLFTQALADLRLDGLLTLIAMTYGRLGDLLVLLRYPEQLQGTSREFNALLETASLTKMKDSPAPKSLATEQKCHGRR